MNLRILELMVTSGLVVLIWLIQILHYPSFRFVRTEDFPAFSAFHANRISWIVIPLMFAEVGLAAAQPRLIILILVTGVWLSTFLLQVPCHNKLTLSHDPLIVERLVSTNWIRTILWTIKLILLVINF
jgi:hypothetical protein